MSQYRDGAGAVAIATGGESAYGTADTLTHLLHVNRDVAGAALAAEQFDKGTLATGQEESIGSVITKWITRPQTAGPACDISLPIHLAFALGSDSRSAVDTASASLHTITPASSVTELKSTTMQAKNTTISDTSTNEGRSYTFAGCVLDNFTLSGDSESGIWTYTGDWVSKGYDEGTSSDVSALTAPSRLPLLFGGTQFVTATSQTTAPTFDNPTSGAAATGGWGSTVDWGQYVRSCSYSIANGVTARYGYNTDGTAHKALRGVRSQTLTVRLEYEGDTATIRQLLGFGSTAAGSEFAKSLIVYNIQNELVGSTFFYAFGLYFPKASLISVTSPAGSPREFDCTFAIRNNNAGENSVYAYVVNKAAESSNYC